MTIEQIKAEFIEQLKEYEYEPEFIEKISNDEEMLKWIQYCFENPEIDAEVVADLFEDAGFIEGMEYQYETPITFEEMKGTEDE